MYDLHPLSNRMHKSNECAKPTSVPKSFGYQFFTSDPRHYTAAYNANLKEVDKSAEDKFSQSAIGHPILNNLVCVRGAYLYP